MIKLTGTLFNCPGRKPIASSIEQFISIFRLSCICGCICKCMYKDTQTEIDEKERDDVGNCWNTEINKLVLVE